jgi:MFS family permease
MKTNKKLRKRLWMYYAFRVLGNTSFLAPIFMLFLIDRGLSSTEIFVTQAAYMLADLLLTVPAGAFADKFGRKKALFVSAAIYSVGSVVYGLANGFVDVLFAELLFAVSSATFHGVSEALLYDMLAEEKQEKRYKNALGTAYALQAVVIGLAAVAGGWMAKYDLSLPFFASAVPSLLGLLPLAFLHEPKRKEQRKAPYVRLIKDAALFVAGHSKIRNVMYFVSVTSLAGFVGWMLYQPMLTKMGMKVEYLGVFMLVLSLSRGLGNKLAYRFEQRLGHLDLMMLFAGFRAVLYLLMYVASGYYLVVWAVLFDFVGGIGGPLVSEWVNRHTKSENRATVLSLSTMSGSLAIAALSPVVGMFVDAYSEQTGYLLLAIVLGGYAVRQLAMNILAKKA